MDFKGKKAALHTLGCKVNEYEADAMRASLEGAGFSIVDFSEKADVYVVNTCSVTNIADRKSRQMISRAKRHNPDAVVVAAGCYVQTALERTGKSVDADILLGSGRKGALVGELERYFAAMDAAALHARPVQGENAPGKFSDVDDVMNKRQYDELSLPRIVGHTRAWIKVQDGCSLFCSYCIIPFARGRIRSRAMDDVLREVEGLARQGVREVVLTGIHLSSYGVDFAGDTDGAYGRDGASKTWRDRSMLIDLVEKVCAVEGIGRVRLGSLEPTIITERFVGRLRGLKELCPHFHLSLQSGSDSVLKRMNRHYSAQEYLDCVNLLRREYDRPAVTTDVIVGFPGESEAEFDETRRFLEKLDLYETHLFRYSMRAGTRAARMPDQIPEAVKEERLAQLAAIDRKKRRLYERSWDGSTVEVLFEEKAQIDEHGTISVPNSGRVPDEALDPGLIMEGGNALYTGYTREYVRVFARSAQDLRGQIRHGKLHGLKIEC